MMGQDLNERIQRQLFTLRHQALRARLEARRLLPQFPSQAEELLLKARNLEVIAQGLSEELHAPRMEPVEARAHA